MLLLAIVALGVPLAVNLSGRVNAEVRTQAQSQADLVAATAADLLGAVNRRELRTLAVRGASPVRGRILIVNASGAVLVDSGKPPEVGQNYESRPEIERALDGQSVQVERFSKTLGQEILATAVPIMRNGVPAGAVRVTQSVSAVHAAVRRVVLELGLIALIVLALGLFAGGLIAAQVARPLKRLEQIARRVAHGDLSTRAEVAGSREQRSLASSFNEMTARIARLLRAQRDFVADASHQLRTPLTALRLRLEEARAIEADPVASVEIDAAIAEVDRLAHTVEELLLLSRAGERQLVGSPIDLEELTVAALSRWRAAAEGAGITLVHSSDGNATAWAARADLERALDVLIENALRYSPAETTVTLTSAPGRIKVLDRGPGLVEEEREIVFERFHRGQAGRVGPPGTGLGLAIARELAREWGGEVTLEDREGGGAAAILSVPVRSAQPPAQRGDFAHA